MIQPEILTGRLGNKMFQIAYLYARFKDGTIPDWYLQSPEYFKGYEDEIKQLFGQGIGFLEQIGIHVRRGTNPYIPSEPKYNENSFYFNLCNTDYYERAMEMFPNEKFVIFSDDPEWCKEKFKGENIQVMDKGDEVEDLNLFASCKSQIIANSSWSWWGAFLNPNESKKVIAPKRWFADGIKRVGLPNSWIQI